MVTPAKRPTPKEWHEAAAASRPRAPKARQQSTQPRPAPPPGPRQNPQRGISRWRPRLRAFTRTRNVLAATICVSALCAILVYLEIENGRTTEEQPMSVGGQQAAAGDQAETLPEQGHPASICDALLRSFLAHPPEPIYKVYDANRGIADIQKAAPTICSPLQWNPVVTKHFRAMNGTVSVTFSTSGSVRGYPITTPHDSANQWRFSAHATAKMQIPEPVQTTRQPQVEQGQASHGSEAKPTYPPSPTVGSPTPGPRDTTLQAFATCNGRYSGQEAEDRLLAAETTLERGYRTLAGLQAIVAEQCREPPHEEPAAAPTATTVPWKGAMTAEQLQEAFRTGSLEPGKAYELAGCYVDMEQKRRERKWLLFEFFGNEWPWPLDYTFAMQAEPATEFAHEECFVMKAPYLGPTMWRACWSKPYGDNCDRSSVDYLFEREIPAFLLNTERMRAITEQPGQ